MIICRLFLLSLGLQIVLKDFLLFLFKLIRIKLSLAITVKGLMLLMVTFRVCNINTIFELLTLVLQIWPLLFEFPQLVEECTLHLFFVAFDFLLDLKFLLVLHGTLEVNTWFVVFHASRHSSIIGWADSWTTASIVIVKRLYASFELFSLLLVLLVLFLSLSILLHILHLLVLQGMFEFFSVLLSLPVM